MLFCVTPGRDRGRPEEGIAITAQQTGNFVYMNRNILRMFGFERPGQIEGQSWTDSYSPRSCGGDGNRMFPRSSFSGRKPGAGGQTGCAAMATAAFPQEISLTLLDDGG